MLECGGHRQAASEVDPAGDAAPPGHDRQSARLAPKGTLAYVLAPHGAQSLQLAMFGASHRSSEYRPGAHAHCRPLLRTMRFAPY